MTEEIFVGMGQYTITNNGDTLVCLSLGSCIGVAIFDSVHKIGGLAHIMLPESNIFKKEIKPNQVNRFADICIQSMVKEMKNKGANQAYITSKIVGGAHMFPDLEDKHLMEIGKKNEQAVQSELDKLHIKISASETGGNIGRTMKFNTDTGEIIIRTKFGEKKI